MLSVTPVMLSSAKHLTPRYSATRDSSPSVTMREPQVLNSPFVYISELCGYNPGTDRRAQARPYHRGYDGDEYPELGPQRAAAAVMRRPNAGENDP